MNLNGVLKGNRTSRKARSMNSKELMLQLKGAACAHIPQERATCSSVFLPSQLSWVQVPRSRKLKKMLMSQNVANTHTQKKRKRKKTWAFTV